jgi:DNA polymerase
MTGPAAPRVNPLQRLWLREIGVEKTWLPADAAESPAGRVATRATPGVSSMTPVTFVGAETPVRSEAPVMSMRPAVEPPAKSSVVAPVREPALAPATRASEPAAVVADDGERGERIAHADLQALREMVESCTACGLCKGRRHAVFGTGAQAPTWMVVGEAPGEQEDRQGLPFVGRSGQLLDAMLASVGKSRERDVFIANVIKCRPPGNRNPTPEEIAACSPYLMRQIALLQPQRILVVGRFAAQTLLNTDATIGSLRGRVHAVRVEGREIPVVVSYHPAYLLRSPSEKARSWQDLRLAARG